MQITDNIIWVHTTLYFIAIIDHCVTTEKDRWRLRLGRWHMAVSGVGRAAAGSL